MALSTREGPHPLGGTIPPPARILSNASSQSTQVRGATAAMNHRSDTAPLTGLDGLHRRTWSPELVLLGASVLMLVLGNRPFLTQALAGRDLAAGASWGFGAALVLALLAINFLLLALLAWGRLFKPVVVGLLVATASAAHFIGSFGIVIDAAMLRNALQTHWGEASELIGGRLVIALILGALLPAWLLSRLVLEQRRWPQALLRRGVAIVVALLTLVGAIWVSFQPLASLMRNQRELRYLITPANVMYAGASLARSARLAPAGPLAVVGADAHAGPTLAAATPARPRVVVLVVGETARAANWGLNGYARATTPQLAKLPVVNFGSVSSCGTDTETSLPCMFAAIGRRQYDEQRIRHSQNLLHVAGRAGVGVHWRDNQSGCKGVCDGFAGDTVAALAPPGLCRDGACLDEGLLHGLEGLVVRSGEAPVRLVVLHQIGNHGPAYHRRVPPAFKHFQPACEHDDLRRCSTEEIVNAYDNALRYTDHVLALLIQRLQALAAQVDSAVLYVSDHGESLGERGLFLHGLPYAIAPEVQTRVPMVMWVSSGFAGARKLDAGCLAARAALPGTSHDHLFHTVLGLLDVRTQARDAALDLTEGCVGAAPAEAPRATG